MDIAKTQVSRRTLVTLNAEGYEVGIDGRILCTPGNHSLILPTVELAEAIASEWDVYLFEHIVRTENGRPTLHQDGELTETPLVEVYSYNTLPPLTRLAALAIDRVAPQTQHYLSEIMAILQSDILLPQHVKRHDYSFDLQAYQELITWFERLYNLPLQESAATGRVLSFQRVQEDLNTRTYWELAALHRLAASLGSVILALGCIYRKIPVATAFRFLEVFERTSQDLEPQKPPLAQKRLVVRTDLIVVERFVTLSKCWDSTAHHLQATPLIAESSQSHSSIIPHPHELTALRFNLH